MLKKLFVIILAAAMLAGSAIAEMPSVTDMPVIEDESIPFTVNVGDSVTLTTEVNMDGTARVNAGSDPYETLTFTVTCDGAKGPLYFFDTYHGVYKLNYKEAVVQLNISLVGYTGSQTIIPQQCMLFTLCDSSRSIIRKGYQLQDFEIDGNAGIEVVSDYPVTLYKRFTFDETTDPTMMQYLCVTTYTNGCPDTCYFKLFTGAETDNTFTMLTETLSRGSTGTAVKILQTRLITLGFLNDKADGSFGGNTERAVMDAQTYMGLEANGVADPAFLRAIMGRA